MTHNAPKPTILKWKLAEIFSAGAEGDIPLHHHSLWPLATHPHGLWPLDPQSLSNTPVMEMLHNSMLLLLY